MKIQKKDKINNFLKNHPEYVKHTLCYTPLQTATQWSHLTVEELIQSVYYKNYCSYIDRFYYENSVYYMLQYELGLQQYRYDCFAFVKPQHTSIIQLAKL